MKNITGSSTRIRKAEMSNINDPKVKGIVANKKTLHKLKCDECKYETTSNFILSKHKKTNHRKPQNVKQPEQEVEVPRDLEMRTNSSGKEMNPSNKEDMQTKK